MQAKSAPKLAPCCSHRLCAERTGQCADATFSRSSYRGARTHDQNELQLLLPHARKLAHGVLTYAMQRSVGQHGEAPLGGEHRHGMWLRHICIAGRLASAEHTNGATARAWHQWLHSGAGRRVPDTGVWPVWWYACQCVQGASHPPRSYTTPPPVVARQCTRAPVGGTARMGHIGREVCPG